MYINQMSLIEVSMKEVGKGELKYCLHFKMCSGNNFNLLGIVCVNYQLYMGRYTYMKMDVFPLICFNLLDYVKQLTDGEFTLSTLQFIRVNNQAKARFIIFAGLFGNTEMSLGVKKWFIVTYLERRVQLWRYLLNKIRTKHIKMYNVSILCRNWRIGYEVDI